ncbi:MAG: ATP-binding protein [Patescibacteria group bacterium]
MDTSRGHGRTATLAAGGRGPSAAGVRFGLQTRMIVTILLLLTAVMLLTTYMGIRRESQGIMDQMRKDGLALANAYALSAENALLLKKAGLGRVTGEASRTKGIKYLKIIDAQGVIIGHTDVSRIGRAERNGLFLSALRTPITAVEKGKRPIIRVDRGRDGERVLRVIVPLVALDSVKGALEIGLDMAGIAGAVRRTNTQSLIISLAAFVFGGLGVWYFARSLTRPIKDLVHASERIAAGDLEHEIRVAARDEIGHLAASFNHMTERLREYTGSLIGINAQLERLRRYTENILESITPGVLTIDLAGVITTLNSAGEDILGLKSENVAGREIGEALRGQARLRSALEESLNKGLLHHALEIPLEVPARGETILLLNTALLNDEDSRAVGVAATFEDVTEVRQLQRRIMESEKLAAMGELAVGIAHEIRNPLGAVKNCAQFLEERLGAEDPRLKFTRLIVREVERLDQLVERLLDFTRPAEANRDYEDVNGLLDKAVELAGLRIGGRRLCIEKLYEPRLPRIPADAKRLHQAFLNILLNAIDAMPGGGTLTIRTSLAAPPDSIRIEFCDTGEGIPEASLAKVFTPFYTTRPKGTGLGLSIVHQIITEHAGAIAVESRRGEGTRFVITLPLAAGRV